MDKDEALDAVRAVERGEAPSGSVIIALTGPNSLLTPGRDAAEATSSRSDTTEWKVVFTVIMHGIDSQAGLEMAIDQINAIGYVSSVQVEP